MVVLAVRPSVPMPVPVPTLPHLLRLLLMPMKQMPCQRLPDWEEPIQKSMALKPPHHLLMKDPLLQQTMPIIMQLQ